METWQSDFNVNFIKYIGLNVQINGIIIKVRGNSKIKSQQFRAYKDLNSLNIHPWIYLISVVETVCSVNDVACPFDSC